MSIPLSHHQHELLEVTLASIGDAVIATDCNFCVTFMNAAAGSLTGWRREEALGQPLNRVFQIVNETTSEAVLIRKDGTRLPVDDTRAPIKSKHGETLGVVLIFRDITERKRAERELRKSEEQFRQVFEESPVGMVFQQSDFRYLKVNPAFCRMIGYSEEELLKLTFLDVTHPDDCEIGVADAQRVFRDELQSFRVEKRYITKSGDTIWANLNTSPVRDEHGRILYNLVVAENITDRKLAAQELERKTVELTRSNTDLQQFAYVTSHDLQEPLRMIGSYAELLSRRYQGNLDADADEFLGYITGGVQRMEALIRALLSYSRVISGERLQLKPVPLDGIVEQALLNLKLAIEDSDATVTCDALPVIPCNPVHFVQLFQNLIGNALKYRSSEPPKIHVSARQASKEWVISVRDNGIGIDPAQAARIFGVFTRLHGRDVPGTGIGLAICKKIIEQHDGRIWVESAPGEGANFLFSIAIYQPKG